MNITLLGRRFAPAWWTLLLTAFTMALFCRLGVWQLHRADYKQELLQLYASRAGYAPLDWAGLQARGKDVLAWPLRLPGRYDNSRQVLLDNQFEDGRPGYHVLTVFAGGGGAVLVDRGWLAAPADHSLPPVPAASATVVQGVVGKPSQGLVVGAEDYRSRPLKVLHLDMPALSTALGVALPDYVVRLDPAAPDGFDRHWPPVVNPEFGPEKSRAYAFQWFSLMLAVLVVFVVVNIRRDEP